GVMNAECGVRNTKALLNWECGVRNAKAWGLWWWFVAGGWWSGGDCLYLSSCLEQGGSAMVNCMSAPRTKPSPESLRQLRLFAVTLWVIGIGLCVTGMISI